MAHSPSPNSSAELRATGKFVYSLMTLLQGGKWTGLKGGAVQTGIDCVSNNFGQGFRDQMQFEVLTDPDSVVCHREAEDLVADLVEDQDWRLLAELISEWDQSRAACPIKRKLIYTAMECVTDTLRDLHGLDDLSQLPSAALETLVSKADRKGQYALKAIQAHVRIAQAWDAEGHKVGVSNGVKAKAYVARAKHSISGLDAKKLKSPLLASVQFALLPFLPETKTMLPRLYETRVHLDADDIAPHYNVGRLLLPRYFGSYDRLELLGRQAVAWTHRRMGAAAYAALYLGALNIESAPLKTLDLELFEEGIEDLICFRKRDPAHVPQVVEALWKLANLDFPHGMDTQACHEWDKRCERLGELALEVMRSHLTGVHPGSWQNGISGAVSFVARAAQSELEAGGHVMLTQNGLRSAPGA